MNITPHSSSGGDGRRPPRDRHRLGVRGKGAMQKSKKRQQRKTQPSHRPGTTDRASPVFTAADLACEGEAYDVMQDPRIFLNLSVAVGNTTGDTGAQKGAAAAQVTAAHAAAAQTYAAQSAAARTAAAQIAATQAAVMRRAEASAEAALPLTRGTSSTSAPGSAARHTSRASASSSDKPVHCPYCTAKCKTVSGVRWHVRTYHDHPGARHCFRCNFAAPDRQTVLLHMQNHTNQRAAASRSNEPIQCPHCPSRYRSYDCVRKHAKAAHDNGNVHHCFRCSFTARDARAVQDHICETHNHAFRCPVCGVKLTLPEHTAHVRNCRR